MLKRVLFITFALITVFSFVTCNGNLAAAIAESASSDSEEIVVVSQARPEHFGFIRNEGGSGIIITYKTVNATTVVVPDRIENLPVVAIMAGLFRNDSTVRSITLPATVTAVPAEAFRGCSSLSSITMPGVTEVGNSAFRGTNFSSLTLPAVITLGNNVFYDLSSLTNISLPSIQTIGQGSFQGCNNLTKVTFGNGLTTLGNNAFQGCINLSDMNVPASLTEFLSIDGWGYRAAADHFSGCQKLPLATRDQLVAQGYGGRGF